MAHYRRCNARHFHGSAGHHRRQCLPDAYCREPLGHAQRSNLGAHVLLGGQRHCHSDFRMAGKSHRTKEPALGFHGRLYTCLFAVWHRAQHGPAGDLPRHSGCLWWFPATAVPSRDAGGVSSQATRQGDGDLGDGGHCGAGARTGSGWLADRQLLLALGLLHQPASWFALYFHDQSLPERPTVYPALVSGGGFLGAGDTGCLGGRASDHVGQRAGRGLV